MHLVDMPRRWELLGYFCKSKKIRNASEKSSNEKVKKDQKGIMGREVLYFPLLDSFEQLHESDDIHRLNLKRRDIQTLEKDFHNNWDVYLMPHRGETIFGLCKLTGDRKKTNFSLKWIKTKQTSREFFIKETSKHTITDMYKEDGVIVERIIQGYLDQVYWSNTKSEGCNTQIVTNQPTPRCVTPTRRLSNRSTESQERLSVVQNSNFRRKNDHEAQVSLMRRDSRNSRDEKLRVYTVIHTGSARNSDYNEHQYPRERSWSESRQSYQRDNKYNNSSSSNNRRKQQQQQQQQEQQQQQQQGDYNYDKDQYQTGNLNNSNIFGRQSVNVLLIKETSLNYGKSIGVLQFELSKGLGRFLHGHLNNNSYLCGVNSATRKLGRLAKIDNTNITISHNFASIRILYSFIEYADVQEELPTSDDDKIKAITTIGRETIFVVTDSNLAENIYKTAMKNTERAKEADIVQHLNRNSPTSSTRVSRSQQQRETYNSSNGRNINTTLGSSSYNQGVSNFNVNHDTSRSVMGVETAKNYSTPKISSLDSKIVLGNESNKLANHYKLSSLKNHLLRSRSKISSSVQLKSVTDKNLDGEDRRSRSNQSQSEFGKRNQETLNFENDVSREEFNRFNTNDVQETNYGHISDRSVNLENVNGVRMKIGDANNRRAGESEYKRDTETDKEKHSDYERDQNRDRHKSSDRDRHVDSRTRSDSSDDESKINKLFNSNRKVSYNGALTQETIETSDLRSNETSLIKIRQQNKDNSINDNADLREQRYAHNKSYERAVKYGSQNSIDKAYLEDPKPASDETINDCINSNLNEGTSNGLSLGWETSIKSGSRECNNPAYKIPESLDDEKRKDSAHEKEKLTVNHEGKSEKCFSIPTTPTFSAEFGADKNSMQYVDTEIKTSEENKTKIYHESDLNSGKLAIKHQQIVNNNECYQDSSEPKRRKTDDLANSLSKYKRKAMNSGLQNIGNTCYMNSVLQCLTIVNWESLQNDMDGSHKFVRDFIRLMVNMTSGSSDVISPRDLKKSFHSYNTRFSTSNQQDSHEFLTFILYTLRENLSENGKEFLTDNFRGRLDNVTHVKCPGYHDIIASQDLYTISLPVKFNGIFYKRVEASIAKFIEDEDLDKEDKVRCKQCKDKFCCSLQMCFGKLPPILVLHLKKFDFVTRQKLDVDLKFPFKDLKVSEMNSEMGRVERVYDLYGVCNHYGSLSSGHYTAFVKSQISDEWYEYNDSSVYQVPEDEVRRSSPTAYLLFYKLAESSTDSGDYNGTDL